MHVFIRAFLRSRHSLFSHIIPSLLTTKIAHFNSFYIISHLLFIFTCLFGYYIGSNGHHPSSVLTKLLALYKAPSLLDTMYLQHSSFKQPFSGVNKEIGLFQLTRSCVSLSYAKSQPHRSTILHSFFMMLMDSHI